MSNINNSSPLWDSSPNSIPKDSFLAAKAIFNFKEASEKDLSTKRRIIYLIQNQYDYKGYVGKSIHSFKDRYTNGKWWHYTTNILLLRTLRFQRPEGFKIFILEYGIEFNNVLRTHETYWAELLNTYAPNGYNIRECGEGGEFFG